MVEALRRALGGFFLVKLLSLSMRDDLSRGDGHLHRQSESEVCDGVHLCINVTAENIRHENLVDILPNLKDWDSYESLARTRSVSACEYHYTERIDIYPLGILWWKLYAAHWEFLLNLLGLSMRDDLSRGDGHLHRQSAPESIRYETLIRTGEIKRIVMGVIPFWAVTLLYDLIALHVSFLPFLPWERLLIILLICLLISVSLLLGLGALIYVGAYSVISVLRNC